MNKQINSQQAAFLSYLVYTQNEENNQYIFDSQEVTEGEKTLRDYIYDQDGNFRQGIPQALKDKINSQPDTFNKILDNFQLKDTTNSIDGAETIGGQGYYAIAVQPKDDLSSIMIVNKGTSEFGDYISNGQMLMGNIAENMLAGTRFAKKIADINDSIQRIITTGHSLGGAISQAQSAYIGDKLENTYTFEAFGIHKIMNPITIDGQYYEIDMIDNEIVHVAVTDPDKIALYNKYAENKDFIDDKILNYLREGDYVDPVSDNIGQTIMLPGGGILDSGDIHKIHNYLYQGYDDNGNIIPDKLNIDVVLNDYGEDIALIAKAEMVLQQLMEKVVENPLNIADFEALYKLALEDAGIDESLLNEARGRLADFKDVFGDYANFNEMLIMGTNVNDDSSQGELLRQLMALLAEGVDINQVGNVVLDDLINQLFNSALNAPALRQDPLVLDLDGDGIETIDTNRKVMFDHTGDNVYYATGWVGKDDALLVRDINGNGRIDNGLELFGENTIKQNGQNATDGFDALSDLDDNQDGVFDAQDIAFTSVKIWQDADQDGFSKESELKSLTEVGINSISINKQSLNQEVLGATLAYESSYQNNNGQSYQIVAANFNENSFHKVDMNNMLEITTADVKGAVGVEVVMTPYTGYGVVKSMRQSLQASQELREIKETLIAGSSYDPYLQLDWWMKAGDDFVSAESMLDGLTLQDGTQIQMNLSTGVIEKTKQTAYLERVNGRRLLDYSIVDKGSYYSVGIKTGNVSFGWQNVSKGGSVTMVDQSFFQLVNGQRSAVISEAFQLMVKNMKEHQQANRYQAVLTQMLPYITIEQDASGVAQYNWQRLEKYFLEMAESNPEKSFSRLEMIIERQQQEFQQLGFDALKLANDMLAAPSNKMLAELSALDSLEFMNQTYHFVCASQSEHDLDNYLVGNHRNENIYGLSGNDTLEGGGGSDDLYGGLGDDKLYGNGDDYLYGGAGDDTLLSQGNWQHNTLIGGKGDDLLITYNYTITTYVYELGDGIDTIRRGGSYPYDRFNDVLRFGAGITFEDLSLSKQGNNLDIQVGDDENNRVLIENFYAVSGYTRTKVGGFEFADGTVIKREDARLNPDIVGDALANTLSGTDFGERFFAYAGDDVVHAGSGNDMIEAGLGDDIIYAGAGADIVYAGAGDDVVYGQGGFDQLYGEGGNDTLYGHGSNSEVYGGAGDDTLLSQGNWQHNTLIGGQGNDLLITYNYTTTTYVYELGDGIDTIRRGGSYPYDRFNDVLRFGAGITFEDLSLSKQGNNLDIQVGDDENNRVLIENFYAVSGYTRTKVGGFEFADGTVIKREDARLNPDIVGDALANTLSGTDFGERFFAYAGDDVVHAGGGNDMIEAGAGNDVIYAGAGADIVYAGAGDDVVYGQGGFDQLYGEEGNDTLYGHGSNSEVYGGAGDDILLSQGNWQHNTLIGGKGDDLLITYNYTTTTYVYELGDGIDTIRRGGSYPYDRFNDVLRFGAGITFEDLSLSKQGNNLDIQVGDDENNRVLIENFYAVSGYTRTKVSGFEFADGTVIKREDARLNPDIVGDALANTLSGTDFGERFFAYAGDDVVHAGSGNDMIEAGAGNDVIYAGAGADIVYAGAGDDVVHGQGGFDQLYGEEGNDTLYGHGSNSEVYGGAGDDTLLSQGNWQHNTLIGGKGDDLLITYNYTTTTYVYERGDGIDTIRRGGSYPYDRFNDVLRFGGGIPFDDLSLSKQGNNLDIQVGDDENNRVLIENFYAVSGYTRTKVSGFEFADGTVIKREDARLNPDIVGDALANTLSGTDFAENLRGGEGDDHLMGAGGSDYLYGEAGNDTLTGNGNDFLYGGAGNDILLSQGNWQHNTLIGGKGDDLLITYNYTTTTYVYELGDGIDTIRRGGSYPYDRFNDVLRFGAGISFEDLSLSKQGNNLDIQVGNDENNRVLIENFYAVSGYTRTKVSGFEFADGTVVKREDARLNPDIIGDALANTLSGTDFAENLRGGEGDDHLMGAGGSDYLYGEAGNDTLTGNGNDFLYGGAGNDILLSQGNWQHNTLIGGKGDDLLITYNYTTTTYVYELGDGIDTIRRGGSYPYDRFNDVLRFGAGISFEDLSLSKQGNNLGIQVGDDENNRVLIENFYAVSGYTRTKVSGFEFADGTVLKRENVQSGSDNNDILVANGDLNYLHGGNGEDSYAVDFSQTQKTIVNNYDNDNSTDFMKLNGVKTTDLRFYREVSNLMIKNLADSNKPKEIVVQDWFEAEDHQIDEIEVGQFMLSNKQIDVIIQTLASFNVESGVGEDLLNKDQQDEIKSVLVNSWMPKSA